MATTASEKTPIIHSSTYIAPGVVISGDVVLSEDSSVWTNTVIHGDVNSIKIGKRSSLQELCCVHVGWDNPVVIGDDVTIGHGCIIHGCTIGNCVTIGMGSIIMDGAVINDGSYIGAGSIVTGGTVIPPNSLAFGSPAKVKRETTEAERQDTLASVHHYVNEAKKLIVK